MAQGRNSKTAGSRPASKGKRPGQGTTKPGSGKSGAGKAQTSAQRRQAASKSVARARSGSSGSARIWWTVVPIVVVAAIVITLVGVRLSEHHKAKSGEASGIASAQLVSELTGVPASVSTAVGAGTVDIGKEKDTIVAKLSGARLTANGLPRVLYVGADYCPYCATERWPLTVALLRFGKFADLGTTSSSPSDVYPSTQTLSFHGAKYTSASLVLNAYEMFSNQAGDGPMGYAYLDKVPAADQTLLEQQNNGSFPFINIGGVYIVGGATYNPQLLQGLTRDEIAQDLTDPTSAVAKGIVGSANLITAAICTTTGNTPADVCTAPGVVAAAKKLPNWPPRHSSS